MDQMVFAVQVWLNDHYSNYSSYPGVEENGKTGWPTMEALITALQIELGIDPPTGSFGPLTTSLCPTLSVTSSPSNIIQILQGALYCKGYNPTGFTGTYGPGTKGAIQSFQVDAGLTNADGVTTPMIFKALLNMDAFKQIGDPKIRTIQQNLNRDYNHVIGLIPTDGRYDRNTNKALIYALQVEEGIASPNGTFGPQTISLLPTLSYGSTKRNFVLILQYALYVNGRDPNGFDGSFGPGCRTAVRQFQEFTKLTVDGSVGKSTWSSLMVSYGDKDRPGTACDCVTTITPERAQTLLTNGYTTVGRYIVGGDWKRLKMDELQVIISSGLKIFPIYQTAGNQLGYFIPYQGAKDAAAAIQAAKSYGFKDGTTIYFAVDFDALDGHVTTNILPYFKALYSTMSASNSNYRVGVYGPRNICSRVSKAGYAVTSFVSDMSSGFSGNLGYPLPENWAFDQITTITIGAGLAQIEIDKNIASGKDLATNTVDPVVVEPISPEVQNNIFFNQLDTVYNYALLFTNDDVYMANQLTMQFFRHQEYGDIKWAITAGVVNIEFINFIKTQFNVEEIQIEVFYDTKTGQIMDVPHLFATLNSVTYLTDSSVIPEFAGWAGDLLTLIADATSAMENNNGGTFYQACYNLLAGPKNVSQFNIEDILADVDSVNIGTYLNNNPSLWLNVAVRNYYNSTGQVISRYTEFANNDAGGIDQLYDKSLFLLTGTNADLYALRLVFKDRFNVPDYTTSQAQDASLAFWTYVNNKIVEETYDN